ncbi:MAG: hypothetical protein PHQ12_03965 [Chthoniobacteraceae bacterium]|nr:hypothetical protein [Chthoniobacteraceae bacterium]
MKSALEEVTALRRVFRATLKHFSAGVESDLDRLDAAVHAAAEKKTALPADRARDARDLVTLIRTLDVKPEKGRRRDLKKIEGALEDLLDLVKKW